MVKYKASSLWLAAVLGRNRRILRSGDSMGVYGLPASPFDIGEYADSPYRPAGMTNEDLVHVHAFLLHADGFLEVHERADYIEGKSVSATGDSVGRGLFLRWWGFAKIASKLNDIWDITLRAADRTPQAFIKDRATALTAGRQPAFSTPLPKLSIVRAECLKDMIKAVFGWAAEAARGVDEGVLYCSNGMWQHQWRRYGKLRTGALAKYEQARKTYTGKRDGESPFPFTLSMSPIAEPYHQRSPRRPRRRRSRAS